ncbi:hypothetical protein HPB50_001288 [Hyalomma asiaticum]|uniref:Uncharacterized protein n=1 Tax=Hyalomma asiaticum TaxID=266040 RepID=A0ACB7RRE1_HYAAI|nr:hypothetical protein HPB50_001288 [Hyalomma asiaticum]
MEAVRQITDQTSLILQRINTLHIEITSACHQSTGTCAQLKDAIDIAIEEARRDNRALLGEMKKVLLQAGGCVTRSEFFVRGMEKLEATAIIYGYATYAGGRNYLRGYNIMPGVVLENERKCVSLRVWMEVQKGDLDDVVHWPFEHVVRFTIVHPLAGKDCVITCKPCPDVGEFQKPTESGDRSVSFAESVTTEALKRDGYVHNDELRVVWELL